MEEGVQNLKYHKTHIYLILWRDMKMKQKNNDKKITELLVDMGMPINLAKTILYVSQINEYASMDIECGAGIRQPEVSIAMQEMRKRGWVKKSDRKKTGKGRPVHIYTTIVELPKIIDVFEQEKLAEFENLKMNLAKLKNMVAEKTK